MSAEKFEQHKKGLAVERSVKPKKLSEECGRYWRELQRSEYHFNRGKPVHVGREGIEGRRDRKREREGEGGGERERERGGGEGGRVEGEIPKYESLTSMTVNFVDKEEVDYLMTITQEDLCQFFDEYIASTGPQRRKLAVHILPVENKNGPGGENPTVSSETTSVATAGEQTTTEDTGEQQETVEETDSGVPIMEVRWQCCVLYMTYMWFPKVGYRY
jgi:hypothetical protein